MANDVFPALGPAGRLDYKKLLVNSDGELIVSGLVAANITAPTGPFYISVGTATAVAADPLSGTPLTDRVSLSVRNKSATVTIYFGKTAAVTPDDTATGGWEIGPGEDFNIDLDDTNDFYLITPAGQTAVYKILEIAST